MRLQDWYDLFTVFGKVALALFIIYFVAMVSSAINR